MSNNQIQDERQNDWLGLPDDKKYGEDGRLAWVPIKCLSEEKRIIIPSVSFGCDAVAVLKKSIKQYGIHDWQDATLIRHFNNQTTFYHQNPNDRFMRALERNFSTIKSTGDEYFWIVDIGQSNILIAKEIVEMSGIVLKLALEVIFCFPTESVIHEGFISSYNYQQKVFVEEFHFDNSSTRRYPSIGWGISLPSKRSTQEALNDFSAFFESWDFDFLNPGKLANQDSAILDIRILGTDNQTYAIDLFPLRSAPGVNEDGIPLSINSYSSGTYQSSQTDNLHHPEKLEKFKLLRGDFDIAWGHLETTLRILEIMKTPNGFMATSESFQYEKSDTNFMKRVRKILSYDQHQETIKELQCVAAFRNAISHNILIQKNNEYLIAHTDFVATLITNSKYNKEYKIQSPSLIEKELCLELNINHGLHFIDSSLILEILKKINHVNCLLTREISRIHRHDSRIHDMQRIRSKRQ